MTDLTIIDKSESNKKAPAAGPKLHDLLLNELDERHRYSRFIAQAYITWYTFFVTLNLAIMGVFVANAKEIADFRVFVVLTFIIFNGLGALTAYFIYRGTQKQQGRIDEIITELNRLCEDNPAQQAGFIIKTSYPHKLFIRLSIVFAFSLVVLIFFWCIFWVKGF